MPVPAQIDWEEAAIVVGNVKRLIVIVAVPLHPALSAVSV
jgi:hypothetical protein